MNKLARWGVIALLPLLGGCFDMRNDLTVAPDGTATFVATFALSADLMGMMGAAAGAGGGAPTGDDDFCPDELEDVPDGFTATNERSTAENGDLVCTMTVVGPIDRMSELLENAEFNPGGGMEGDDGQITLTVEGGGIYTYSLAFAFEEPAPEEAGMTAMMAGMRDMMVGRTLSWSVTAPRIISTTGTLEGNTATFEIPVTDMIDNAGGKYAFEVRFGL